MRRRLAIPDHCPRPLRNGALRWWWKLCTTKPRLATEANTAPTVRITKKASA